MGIYSKEVFGGDAPTVVADQSTNTACSSYDATHCISAAVIKTVLEGYVAFSAENGSMKSTQDAQQFISNFTKELIDNGDITASDLDDIQSWINKHASIFSGVRNGYDQRLLNRVLTSCKDTASVEDLDEIARLTAQLNQAKAKVLAKYTPAICSEVSKFFQRYGRQFDQTYTETWTRFCDIDN